MSDLVRATLDPPPGGGYALASDVVLLTVDDGSARLLDLDGDFHALPAIGAALLRAALAEGIEPAVRHVAAEYDVDPARVRADLIHLLDDLIRRGLVRTPGARRGARLLRAIAARASIDPALRLIRLTCGRRIHAALLLICARVSFAVFGWAQTVRTWQACCRSPRLSAQQGHEDAIAAIDAEIRDWAARLPLMACKERALCCWYLLSMRGIPATLMVGVQLFPLMGHCWCEADGRVLTDFSDRCDAFTPIARYTARPA